MVTSKTAARILIVDDHPLMREGMATQTSNEADDVEAALQLVREQHAHCRSAASSRSVGLQGIMTIPQPSAFAALLKGHDGECPCCRRQFADGDG
ncbi:MAG: hypothetical protein H6822_00660 [Planctomycetaceae bacterium]|nr:hypothetical protein [Planctomycetales bacterium]MCB9920655.1 hypothetical protein [Planctomycetaceae bacterium]